MLRQISFQQLEEPVRRTTQSDIESAEERINGADVVEAHLVDQLFENQGIVSKKIDTPLPVVEADGAGDDLFHLSGIASAHHAVLVHLALALFHGEQVPVLVFTAAAIHRIKTD